MLLPRIEPMLAHTKTGHDGAEWSIEPKLDGWRAMVYVDNTVTVRTHTGRDVTAQVPEVAPLADVLGRRCILDGELVAGAGLPDDFYGRSTCPRPPKRNDLDTRDITTMAVPQMAMSRATRPTLVARRAPGSGPN